MKNKIDRYIEELTEELFIVEGVITGLLTRETLQNINQKYSSTASGIAVGSALLGQIGSASIANFAANDDGIDVSEFAIELRDQEGVLHYFKGCFPEVIFQEGDQVRVIAQPFKKEYVYVNAIIDIEKQYMWTSQQVEKGRIRYRIFCMKIAAGLMIFTLVFVIIVALFQKNGYLFLMDQKVFGTMFILFVVIVYSGSRVGASFDEQSSELEAILNKIGFYKPTMISLSDYSVFIVGLKNEEIDNQVDERWMQYTYRLDLAKQADAEKYGNKKQSK